MLRVRLLLALAGVAVLVLPACGGGGQGLRTVNDPVLVTSTSIPDMLSGDPIDHVIPIAGGCGGPYVMKVIEGEMPGGLYLDEATHSIRGVILEDGVFDFTIQITDSGCEPFSSTTASFSMTVGVGEIRVVEALLDGNPSLIPPGGETYNPVYPALPAVVYNDFITIELIVAGGHGPYSAVVFDDPAIPNDGPLPLGASIPPASSSITGSPVEVGPAGGPFLVTLEITDSIGGKGYFTCNWMIETPPIIIATESLPDGVCGERYSESMLAVEGVPPFVHEFVEMGLPVGYESDVNPNPQNPGADVLYNPEDDLPPTVTPPQALNKATSAIYPPPTAAGPDYSSTYSGAPPEGLCLDESTGGFFGYPRRRGTFQVHYHVMSSLVPNNFGQHAWQSYVFSMAPAAPLAQDPEYTVEQTPFAQVAPFNRIGDFELGQPYNPDGGAPGLQLLATGGVPYDGISDHPHKSQAEADPSGEVEGAYEWSLDWGPQGQIPGVGFTSDGVLAIVDANVMQTQGFQNLMPTVSDQRLPVSLVVPATETVRVSVGPDVVVISESSTSFTGASGTSYTQDHLGLHDSNMTIKILLPFSSGAQVKPLNDARDLPGTGATQHTLDDLPATIAADPTNGKLPNLLTGLDLLRVSANPTGWWQDSYNMNPRGARGMQHADANKTRAYYGNAFGYNYSSGSYTSGYGASPDSSCVDLPVCTTPDGTLAESLALGIDKKGGKLYAFDSSSYIGVFIVRENSKIYVPFAMSKSGNPWSCTAFGDNWHFQYSATATSMTAGKIPQMTVSPDGRFAAMKLMPNIATYSYLSYPTYAYSWNGNTANQCYIVLFSLTGEKIPAWGGNTWKVIGTGSNGTSSYGQLMLAPSMTLTNTHLYYVCSNRGKGDFYSWREHYCYRYDLDGGASQGSLLSSGHPDWGNTPGNWMQMPNGVLQQLFYNYQSGSYSNQSIYNWLYGDGYNAHEGAGAPHPFRVNADGNACVIVAGTKTSSSSSEYGSDFDLHDVWIDYDAGGGPTLYQLSSTRRHHPHGGGRGIRLTSGPRNGYNTQTHQWGHYTGPTSALEVSDDGLKVAIVCNRKSGTVYHYDYQYQYQNYPSYNWNAREDIIAFVPSGADWSSGATEIQVTGSESSTNEIFTDSPNIQWRFGGLTFTQQGDGLVFWGGFSAYDPDYSSSTSSYYYGAHSFVGSLYAFDFDNPGVYSMLASSSGGANLTVGTRYTSSTRIGTSSWTSTWETDGGVILPIGGFLSANREYLYICTKGSISTSSSNAQQFRVIGANIKSLDGVTNTSNDHAEGRAFAVGNWPSRRGFQPDYGGSSYPYHYYGVRYPYYEHFYGSHIVMAKESGYVFWGAHWQNYGPGRSTSSSYGGPVRSTYYTRYGYGPFAGQLAVFDGDVGGSAYLLSNLSQSLYSNNYTSTTRRYMKYIEPTPDGKNVAYVYSTNNSYSYPVGHGTERMGYITNLQLDPTTGALIGYDNVQDVNGGQGRISTSVAHDSTGGRLFYGYVTGTSSNENAKRIYQRLPTASSSQDLGVSTKRYNILHSGR